MYIMRDQHHKKLQISSKDALDLPSLFFFLFLFFFLKKGEYIKYNLIIHEIIKIPEII